MISSEKFQVLLLLLLFLICNSRWESGKKNLPSSHLTVIDTLFFKKIFFSFPLSFSHWFKVIFPGAAFLILWVFLIDSVLGLVETVALPTLRRL